jgi:hypothetical protein
VVMVRIFHRLRGVLRGEAPADPEVFGGTMEVGGPDRRANRAAKQISLHPRARFEDCADMTKI